MKEKRDHIKDLVSHVYPVKQTKKEKVELGTFIRNKKVKRFDDELLRDKIIEFKLELLDYLQDDNQHLTVGNFLSKYLDIIGIKQNVFAKQLDIHFTKLNNILKNRVGINSFIAYKLEAHSKISALYWIKIHQKSELQRIMQEEDLKKNAYKSVMGGINISVFD